jgi:hypothetical protein
MEEPEVAQLHFVEHAEIMAIRAEQAKKVHKTQVVNATRVRMLNEYGD